VRARLKPNQLTSHTVPPAIKGVPDDSIISSRLACFGFVSNSLGCFETGSQDLILKFLALTGRLNRVLPLRKWPLNHSPVASHSHLAGLCGTSYWKATLLAPENTRNVPTTSARGGDVLPRSDGASIRLVFLSFVEHSRGVGCSRKRPSCFLLLTNHKLDFHQEK